MRLARTEDGYWKNCRDGSKYTGSVHAGLVF